MPSPPDVVPSLPDVLTSTRALVSERLAAGLTRSGARLAHVGPELAPLTEAAGALLRGGKRLRAAFCVAGWMAHGGAIPLAATDPVIGAGAGLELFQAAALVHDDVMDASETRRGLPAAHKRFAALHRVHAWTGESDRFGEAGAILLGDLLLVESFSVIAEALASVPPDAARRAQGIYDLMTAEVTAGQFLDVLAQVQPLSEGADAALDRAQRVNRAKSARYSVEHPITLGAAMAGGAEAELGWCGEFGLPVGEAFQLRDDVLGVFGDPAVTGKPAGDDLREGKRTVLVALALGRGSAAQQAAVRAALGRAEISAGTLDLAREALVETGALKEVEARIGRLTDEASTALESARISAKARSLLRDLARLAVDRKS